MSRSTVSVQWLHRGSDDGRISNVNSLAGTHTPEAPWNSSCSECLPEGRSVRSSQPVLGWASGNAAVTSGRGKPYRPAITSPLESRNRTPASKPPFCGNAQPRSTTPAARTGPGAGDSMFETMEGWGMVNGRLRMALKELHFAGGEGAMPRSGQLRCAGSGDVADLRYHSGAFRTPIDLGRKYRVRLLYSRLRGWSTVSSRKDSGELVVREGFTAGSRRGCLWRRGRRARSCRHRRGRCSRASSRSRSRCRG